MKRQRDLWRWPLAAGFAACAVLPAAAAPTSRALANEITMAASPDAVNRDVARAKAARMQPADIARAFGLAYRAAEKMGARPGALTDDLSAYRRFRDSSAADPTALNDAFWSGL